MYLCVFVRGAPKCRRACVGFIQMHVKSSACGGICAECSCPGLDQGYIRELDTMRLQLIIFVKTNSNLFKYLRLGRSQNCIHRSCDFSVLWGKIF